MMHNNEYYFENSFALLLSHETEKKLISSNAKNVERLAIGGWWFMSILCHYCELIFKSYHHTNNTS